MWGRKPKEPAAADTQSPSQLKEAIHQARVEAAERTNVIVDLCDAELARLELLNEALNPLFADVPPDVDLFDRGISRGEAPRLWIDSVAHVAMGRDKRLYRFLHDSRIGRGVLAESHEIPDVVQAVTTYVARRLVERQRALEADPDLLARISNKMARHYRWRRRWRTLAILALGFIVGVATLFVVAAILSPG
ncbi:MAG: hypothetical protein ACTHJS_01720 [Xanthobacteraceae bacterium]